ncbi:MAG: large subunit ribosomal protein [Gaiellales bacterium]|jgi:large subunit ribosomal protein L24|nr:large subunit ribosomal protein [Gaiellales bacterium]
MAKPKSQQKSQPRLKIRRGDQVEVLTGKDVGRRGKVLEVLPEDRRLIVEKVNMVKRHTKPRPIKGSRGAQMTPGGVIEQEAAIRVDNVALVCPRCNEATRVGYRISDSGEKIRHCRRAGCHADIEK